MRVFSCTAVLLTLALAACKGEDASEGKDKAASAKQNVGDSGGSKKAQACRAERKWAGINEIEAAELARGVESTKQEQSDLHLTDKQYQALLDCKIAANDRGEGVMCMEAAELEAALADLESHVESGAPTEQTLELLRNPKRRLGGRVGSLEARLGIDLSCGIYAAWDLLEKTWTYPIAEVRKQIGPHLKITFGRIAYSRTGEITWPSLSQIKVSPENIDPMQIVKDLVSEGKAKNA